MILIRKEHHCRMLQAHRENNHFLAVKDMTTLNNPVGVLPFGHRTLSYVNSERHFADGLNFYKLFWTFTYGSIIGFVVETIWCLIRNGRFEVRSSFVFGPFSVIYGIGALALYLALRKISSKKPLHIFLVGMVAGTAIEHLCSWVQEMAFGTVSWDYSNVPLNIGGRVCLLYSVFWGLLAILWGKYLQPAMEKSISKIPNRIGKPLTYALLAFFIIVSIISIAAVSRWMMRIDGIPANGIISMLLDQFFHNDFMEIIYSNMKIVG